MIWSYLPMSSKYLNLLIEHWLPSDTCILLFYSSKYVDLLVEQWLHLWLFHYACLFLVCMWICWLSIDCSSDKSLSLHISRMYVNLLIKQWQPFLWFHLACLCPACMCLLNADCLSNHAISLLYFQSVCELFYQGLTMLLRIPYWCSIFSEYVNMVIEHWLHLWWFYLACLLQRVCEIDRALTAPLIIQPCLSISRMYVNMLIEKWLPLWQFWLACLFPESV